jgi:ribulose-phosphate 3-epimerase
MSGRAVQIAPSILTADFGRLAEQVRAAEAGGCDLFHLDVMDGHFVPQLSFGPQVVEAVRRATALPLEVHMMVERPHEHFQPFASAGAQRLVFHYEAKGEPFGHIEAVRALGCEAGIAINPETPASALEPLLPYLDEVVVMLIKPGRGGQEMMPEHLDKVRELRGRPADMGRDLRIEVDGGVKAHNAISCVLAGADILVAGSAVYNERETPEQAMTALRGALASE